MNTPSRIPPEDKKTLRRNALAARAMMAHATGPVAAQRLSARVMELLERLPGRTVAGYMPVRHEIDVHPLMERIAQSGRILVLPVVKRRNAPLVFREWAPGKPLQEGEFGVPVPLPDSPEHRPDILLVPLAAFDREGFRLGYGGGYYDRTLAALRTGRKAVTAVGVAYSGQELDRVPREETDQPLDWIVTDRQTIGPIGTQA